MAFSQSEIVSIMSIVATASGVRSVVHIAGCQRRAGMMLKAAAPSALVTSTSAVAWMAHRHVTMPPPPAPTRDYDSDDVTSYSTVSSFTKVPRHKQQMLDDMAGDFFQEAKKKKMDDDAREAAKLADPVVKLRHTMVSRGKFDLETVMRMDLDCEKEYAEYLALRHKLYRESMFFGVKIAIWTGLGFVMFFMPGWYFN